MAYLRALDMCLAKHKSSNKSVSDVQKHLEDIATKLTILMAEHYAIKVTETVELPSSIQNVLAIHSFRRIMRDS